jgi:hypothetical protein
MEPLIKLTGKGQTFRWGAEEQAAFNELKRAFIREPALANFDPELETIIEVDASTWATGGVMSQYGRDEILHAVAYFSAKNTPAEVNYTIHDKELLVVVKCLLEWEQTLKLAKKFVVVTDYKNLEYFCHSRILSERHVRWSSLLS